MFCSISFTLYSDICFIEIDGWYTNICRIEVVFRSVLIRCKKILIFKWSKRFNIFWCSCNVLFGFLKHCFTGKSHVFPMLSKFRCYVIRRYFTTSRLQFGSQESFSLFVCNTVSEVCLIFYYVHLLISLKYLCRVKPF